MPRITQQHSAAQAKSYYEQSDYYEAGAETKGKWFGLGAEKLGLNGEVLKEHFDRLIDNRHPFTNLPLTPRTRDDRRVSADITFSASKSTSILWAITQDQAIAAAVHESARETMVDMERDAKTRVNTGRNAMHLEKTGVLVGATFLHTTSRPIDGHPDPSLHVHGVVLNCTTRGERWTALEMSAMFRDSKYYESLFQSRLASKIQSLGYSVERSEHNFEIKGISRPLIEKFSRRTAEIEQKAAELGIKSKDAKDKLGATTRQKKTKDVAPEELPRIWRERLTKEESDALKPVIAKALASGPPITAKEAVDYARDHLFEQHSVVRERQLITQAIYRGMGDVSVDEIIKEASSRPWIREGYDENAQITTHEILQEERKLLAFARNGRGAVTPLVPDHQMRRTWLSNEQQTVARGVLNSPDRVQLIIGKAGVGKTTVLQEINEAIEENGGTVIPLAPTTKAVDNLIKDDFDASTLQSFLVDEKRQADAAGKVIWLDESGLVGTPTLYRLTEIAQHINARLILTGDSKQHSPVERGNSLRLLEEQSGLRPWQLTEIRRQQGDYKRAVESLSKGHVLEGFERLEALGFVHELPDEERYQKLAQDYADAKLQGKTTLVIAPTHAEREIVTLAIREELKQRGIIHGKEHELTILKPKQLTTAERSDPLRYAVGDVLEFAAKGKGGIKPGDRLTVTSVDKYHVFAQGPQGAVEVPLSSAGAFAVYRPEKAIFAIGDTIRITRNRAKRGSLPRLTNGTAFQIVGFTPKGELKLDNKTTLDPAYAHFENGLTLTSIKAQGATVQRTILVQGSISFGGASNPEQAYVSASRSRERVDIYSDDVAGLKLAIQHSQPNRLASELNANQPPALPQKQFSRLRKHVGRVWLHSRKVANEHLRQFSERFTNPEPQQHAYLRS